MRRSRYLPTNRIQKLAHTGYRRLRQPHIDRHVPLSAGGKALTFDRVLFGHEHRGITGKRQIPGVVSVVICKGVGLQRESSRPQAVEEALRMSYTRHGMHKRLEAAWSEFAAFAGSEVH